MPVHIKEDENQVDPGQWRLTIFAEGKMIVNLGHDRYLTSEDIERHRAFLRECSMRLGRIVEELYIGPDSQC